MKRLNMKLAENGNWRKLNFLLSSLNCFYINATIYYNLILELKKINFVQSLVKKLSETRVHISL